MGGKGGGGDSGSDATQLYNTMAEISKALYEEATPVRQGVLGMTENILSGDYSPRILPAYAPLYSEAKKGLETQYGTARQNILSQTPRGGQLYAALNDLELDRASKVGSMGSQLTSGLVSDIINRGSTGAFGLTTTSNQGLGTAGNLAGNMAAQEQQADSAKGQGLGQLAGNVISILPGFWGR